MSLNVLILQLDSPIEERLSVPLARAVAPFVRDNSVQVTLTSQWEVPITFASRTRGRSKPAAPRPYRVDFMLEAVHARGVARLAIECDHGFWDWENDDRRQLRISGATGASFVRYTGREIYANADRCADHAVLCFRELIAQGPHADLPPFGDVATSEQAIALAREFLAKLRAPK